jgi:hypothetical protein
MRVLIAVSVMLVSVPAAAGPPFDIVFLLDESGSIDANEFALEKDFIVRSANGLTFGADDVAASLIMFGTTPRLGVNLTTVKTNFINATNSAVRAMGNSDFTAALAAAQNQFASFGRPGADDVIAVVADGPANLDVAGLTPKLDELGAAGVHIFPIAAADAAVSFMQSLVRNDGQYVGQLFLNNSPAAAQAFVSGVLATKSTIPGDYNYNGTVDAADYVLWRFKLGTVGPLINDATPGVTADDYDLWKANFGNALSVSSSIEQVAVPETSAMLLLASGFVLWFAKRDRRI